MGAWTWHIPDATVTGDWVVADLLGLDFRAQPWPQDVVFGSMHPDDLPRVEKAVAASLTEGAPYNVIFRDRILDKETGEEGVRWLGARGGVTVWDEDGTALEMSGINWDASEQVAQEHNLANLAAEVDHRLKNSYAMMQGLVNTGSRFANDVEEFANVMRSQIEALALAHLASGRGSLTPFGATETTASQLASLALTSELASGRATVKSTGTVIPLAMNEVNAFSAIMTQLLRGARSFGVLQHEDGCFNLEIEERADRGTVNLHLLPTRGGKRVPTSMQFHRTDIETTLSSKVIRIFFDGLKGTAEDLEDGSSRITLHMGLSGTHT